MDDMSNYCELLRARIAEKQCRLERIETANLFPIHGSLNAAALVVRELRRQIAVDQRLLADHSRH